MAVSNNIYWQHSEEEEKAEQEDKKENLFIKQKIQKSKTKNIRLHTFTCLFLYMKYFRMRK